MARSRNRPRPRLAWLILLAVGLLILAATRVHAGPPGDLPDVRDGDGREPDPEVAGDSEDEGDESEGEADGNEEPPEDPERPIELDVAHATGLTSRERGEDVDELAEPDRLADLIEDAAVDDPLLRDAIETGVVFATAFADAIELAEFAARHQRPSRFGRLDLTVAWRRGYHVMPIGVVLDGPHVVNREPTTYDRRIDDTVLVLATWRI